jgi:hypothetical protein
MKFFNCLFIYDLFNDAVNRLTQTKVFRIVERLLETQRFTKYVEGKACVQTSTFVLDFPLKIKKKKLREGKTGQYSPASLKICFLSWSNP